MLPDWTNDALKRTWKHDNDTARQLHSEINDLDITVQHARAELQTAESKLEKVTSEMEKKQRMLANLLATMAAERKDTDAVAAKEAEMALKFNALPLPPRPG